MSANTIVAAAAKPRTAFGRSPLPFSLSCRLASLAVILLLCLPAFPPSRAEGASAPSHITARALFALLPPSIFENTGEGLSEDEFDTLIEEGRTEYWSISRDSADDLVVSAVSPVESKVVLHLFHNDDGGVVAALGSQSGIVCALELWRYDGTGKIVPMPVPEQPAISDLFLPDHLPAYIDPTIMMCLERDKIFAKPVLWSAHGIINEPQDFIVHYFWNGREFIKNREAAHSLPFNPAPPARAAPGLPAAPRSGYEPGDSPDQSKKAQPDQFKKTGQSVRPEEPGQSARTEITGQEAPLAENSGDVVIQSPDTGDMEHNSRAAAPGSPDQSFGIVNTGLRNGDATR